MKTRNLWLGASLSFLASAGIAGIPTSDKLTCPVGGKSFSVTGTASCSTFGATQDFFLKVETSCDFVTRLPQCPDNGLPLYKEFTKDEISLLKDYVATPEYTALAGRSRFAIAKKVDDFLVSKGSKSAFGFWYVLGGLQYDREATLSDPEYMGWLQEKGAEALTTAKGVDAAVIRLVMAYGRYLSGDFEGASAGLAAVRADAEVKDHWLVAAYAARLEPCIAARDVKLCPPDMRIKPDAR
ncbi:MAG TPA: hypothetical protein VFV30_09485 [Novosphingobium sp.]|nr:hypothetical protein [Novosphingobium sp.]